MIAQRGFRCSHTFQQRNRPGPWTRRAVRLSDIRRKGFPARNHWPIALLAKRGWRAFFGRFPGLLRWRAPHPRNIFAVIAIGDPMLRKVIPYVSSRRGIDIGLTEL